MDGLDVNSNVDSVDPVLGPAVSLMVVAGDGAPVGLDDACVVGLKVAIIEGKSDGY